MSRLPFDPRKAAGPRKARADDAARRERKRYKHLGEAEHLTVSELADLIKTTLEQRIASPIRVIGQVSNLSTPGHWYFSLKDDAAVVSCVAWASSVKKIGFVPADGDEVVATGHVSHYPPQGRTQLYVTNLKPVGAGALQVCFEQMCQELRKLGYFDEERKKPLPVFPRRIAVITSAGGAAIHDVVATASQRCKAVGLLVVNVRVQGEGAAEDVARAIGWVDAQRDRLGVDAILVTRGGGSIEDLWAFNERIVADAAYACTLPLVAAIGHESDTTVIELVADVRAATPTQAAMCLAPSSEELHAQVNHLQHRLGFLLRRLLEQGRHRLRLLVSREAFRDPGAILRTAGRRIEDLDHRLAGLMLSLVARDRAVVERLAGRLERLRPHVLLADHHERIAVLAHRLNQAVRGRVDQRLRLRGVRLRLDQAVARHIERSHQRVDALSRQIVALDPIQVLERGFSYTTDAKGGLVRSVHDVQGGDRMLTHISDGAIESVVGRALRRARRSKRSRAAGDGTGQMDLFDRGE